MKRLKLPGVEAICVQGPLGQSLLLVSNVFYGPSWAQIYKSLEQLIPTPSLITPRNTPSVLIADSASNRELVASIFERANASRSKQVHLEGIGFVELENKAKPELKLLALPLISIIIVIGLGIFWSNSQKQIPDAEVITVSESCIVDLNTAEFESWLIDSLSTQTELGLGKVIQTSTPKGELNIVVESSIGSAAKVSGVAVCTDGRERVVNHRIDISGFGAVLELGQ